MKVRKISLIILFLIPTLVFAKEKVDFKRCVDGDTAVFVVDGQDVKYRFLAIDTPETVHPTKEVEKYGKNASEYTCNALTNAKTIEIEYENSNKTDKYGRSLGWIWVDNVLLQKELVSIGYAKVAYIYGNYKYTEELCLVQQTAYDSKLGIWTDEDDQGYCSSINVSSVESDSSEKVNEEIIALEETTAKINDFIEGENFSDILLFIILGIGVLSIFFKKKV